MLPSDVFNIVIKLFQVVTKVQRVEIESEESKLALQDASKANDALQQRLAELQQDNKKALEEIKQDKHKALLELQQDKENALASQEEQANKQVNSLNQQISSLNSKVRKGNIECLCFGCLKMCFDFLFLTIFGMFYLFWLIGPRLATNHSFSQIQGTFFLRENVTSCFKI